MIYYPLVLLQLIFRFIFILPPAIAVYLMRFAGEITYQIARRTPIKQITAGNIKALFPEAGAARLADKLLRNIGYSIFEVLCTPFFTEAHLARISRLIGVENLDLALTKRKGAILVIMHMGNYELIPTVLAARGYHLTSILKATHDPYFKILDRSRRWRGTQLINVLEENMYRQSLQALSHNRGVCILIDTGALEGRHETINFLGKKVPAASGWITLAQRSGAPVIPCLAKREGKKVIIRLGEPMEVLGENRELIIEKVRLFYENFLKTHPEQWAIFLNEYEVKRMVEGK